MITSQRGIDLIKDFESLQLKAYYCPANILTIGYGHTKGVRRGDTITAQQAEQLLKQDLVQFEQDVTKLVKVPINQNQFDALVSFAFNLGPRNLSTSTLLRKLNAGDHTGAANEFLRWVNANGKKLAGLERRRLAEKRLFES